MSICESGQHGSKSTNDNDNVVAHYQHNFKVCLGVNINDCNLIPTIFLVTLTLSLQKKHSQFTIYKWHERFVKHSYNFSHVHFKTREFSISFVYAMEADDPPNSLQWMRNGHRRRSSRLQQDIASYKATYQLLHAPHLEYMKKNWYNALLKDHSCMWNCNM